MRFTFPFMAPLLLCFGFGTANAADPTQLAATGGFLLGNAQRCGVAAESVERAGKVIHGFIVAVARGSSKAKAADSHFVAMFLAASMPSQDQDAFPSCTVVIQQFDRLERHHAEIARDRAIRVERPGF